jgi:hypothetical protein
VKATILPDYWHEFEGALYDTRRNNWTAQAVRENYARHHATIESTADLRASLRAGAYTFPGGYSIAYLTNDGAILCPSCVREELRNIIDSIRSRCNDGWLVVALDVSCNTDEGEFTCEHCNKTF